MVQHELRNDVRVLDRYVVDTLGAPFKVTLLESVSVSIDPKTGATNVKIPDLIGLINAVVRVRVFHGRKLSGPELKFVRMALGIRAKVLAKRLGITAEHLSRCEAGSKIMSESSEKLFRLVAFYGTLFEEPEDLLRDAEAKYEVAAKPPGEPVNSKKPLDVFDKAFRMVMTMKITPVFSAGELEFEFARRRLSDHPVGDSEDDGEWIDEKLQAA